MPYNDVTNVRHRASFIYETSINLRAAHNEEKYKIAVIYIALDPTDSLLAGSVPECRCDNQRVVHRAFHPHYLVPRLPGAIRLVLSR